MTRREALQAAQTRLRQGGKEQGDARLLLQHVLQLSHEQLLSSDHLPLSEAEAGAYDALIARRLAHEPVSQLVGYRDFWKDRFVVSRDVLSPRADSETLIEAALEQAARRGSTPQQILDLGTGSGCLLISLLREFPAAKGTGVDRSAAALQVAQENLRRCALTEHAVLLQGSWVEPLQSRFDMVISNPPYIGAKEMPHLMPEVRDYEPAMALTAGEDGLDDYRMLLQVVPPVLNPGGCFILELGAGQAEAVCALAEQANWTVTQLKLDMAGIPRALTLTR